MKRRILHLRVEPEPEDVLGSIAWEGDPPELPNPLQEMERAAIATAAGDPTAATDAVTHYQRRLQQTAIDELHRLVGELMAEVALAEGLEGKIGRAIVNGTRLVESRPADHLLRQFADPVAFVARCRAICAAARLFLGATLNRELAARGLAELTNPDDLIDDIAGALAEREQEVQSEGLDTKLMLVREVLVRIEAAQP